MAHGCSCGACDYACADEKVGLHILKYRPRGMRAHAHRGYCADSESLSCGHRGAAKQCQWLRLLRLGSGEAMSTGRAIVAASISGNMDCHAAERARGAKIGTKRSSVRDTFSNF